MLLKVAYNVEVEFTPDQKAMVLSDKGVPGFYRAALERERTDRDFFENFRGGEVEMFFQKGVSEDGTQGKFESVSHNGKKVYPV